MKKAILGMIALLFFSLPAYTGAQDRSRMSIFVPVPVGGTGQQQVYFQNNFKKELVGANYPVAETRASSQYSMVLDISDNLYFDPLEPVDEQNQMYILAVTLERSADAQEIVNFSFPFNDPESMAEWNLFLLYQALADAVPISEAAQVGEAKEINVPPPPPTSVVAPQIYATFTEGLTASWLTRIVYQTDRSNFVFSDFLPGAFFAVELRNFPLGTPVARLAAYYPLVSTFNKVEQKPKVPLHYGGDFTLGLRFELDFIKYFRITLGPAAHLFFLDSERWRYWNLGGAGMLGVELPVSAGWTFIVDALASLDNGNLGANKDIEPFDMVYQYQVDIAVRYSKKLRNITGGLR